MKALLVTALILVSVTSANSSFPVSNKLQSNLCGVKHGTIDH